MIILANELRLHIFKELTRVVTDTHYLNVLEIMNDSLADRYFSIIQKQIKDEQTYLATIQRQHDLRRGGKPLIRQTL